MKWNRTKEILPEAGQTVLVAVDDFDDNLDVFMAFVDTDEQWYSHADRFYLPVDPEYWAEVPTRGDIEDSIADRETDEEMAAFAVNLDNFENLLKPVK